MEEAAKYNIRTTENQYAHLKSANVSNDMPIFGGKVYNNKSDLQSKLNVLRTKLDLVNADIKFLREQKKIEVEELKVLLRIKTTYFNIGKYGKLNYSDLVIRVVCDILKVSEFDIKSPNRKREFVYARGIIWAIWRKNIPSRKLTFMGKVFNRDHSTVIHGLKVQSDLRESDFDFNVKCEMIERLLESYISKQDNYIYE